MPHHPPSRRFAPACLPARSSSGADPAAKAAAPKPRAKPKPAAPTVFTVDSDLDSDNNDANDDVPICEGDPSPAAAGGGKGTAKAKGKAKGPPKPRVQKKWVPKYKTANFALLVALDKLQRMGHPVVSKEQLIQEAEDSELSADPIRRAVRTRPRPARRDPLPHLLLPPRLDCCSTLGLVIAWRLSRLSAEQPSDGHGESADCREVPVRRLVRGQHVPPPEAAGEAPESALLFYVSSRRLAVRIRALTAQWRHRHATHFPVGLRDAHVLQVGQPDADPPHRGWAGAGAPPLTASRRGSLRGHRLFSSAQGSGRRGRMVSMLEVACD